MSDVKFHKTPSTGSRVAPYGQTDNEANSRLSQFSERAAKRSLKELTFREAQRGVLLTGAVTRRNKCRSSTIQ